jgi:hypothetical protein
MRYRNESTDRWREYVLDIGRYRLIVGDLVPGSAGFWMVKPRYRFALVAAWGWWLQIRLTDPQKSVR